MNTWVRDFNHLGWLLLPAWIIEDYLLLEEKVDTLGSVLLNGPYGIHIVSSGELLQ
ncbi:hypothetical protein MHB50_14920 [Siminovitchia sp. FSL H7-0308]|uniref:hypothetical protein n=1 Tax=Siminovitchia sp. FSL H7-0308 TaxID=2921432 RepID=UPI0030EBFECA